MQRPCDRRPLQVGPPGVLAPSGDTEYPTVAFQRYTRQRNDMLLGRLILGNLDDINAQSDLI